MTSEIIPIPYVLLNLETAESKEKFLKSFNIYILYISQYIAYFSI